MSPCLAGTTRTPATKSTTTAQSGPPTRPRCDQFRMTITSPTRAGTELADSDNVADDAVGLGAGRAFVVRRGLVYTAGMVAANAFGAVVTFVYAAEVVPRAEGPGDVHA